MRLLTNAPSARRVQVRIYHPATRLHDDAALANLSRAIVAARAVCLPPPALVDGADR
ncbi:hypothetical protein [Amycolatopsis sp. RTGN1]|uniref:hypothetical protein n=1 Tax=Amycolatopsis ponsaeliensis TaxID=2992142 RepID=UPI00254DA69E|nr:hypothetical protein [Amycolatopsis sp. RTGN1]